MKLTKPLLFFFASFFLCYNALAQFQGLVYKTDSSIKVFSGGTQKTLAWCGGFDNPEFGLADLNHDGLKDLVIFERGTGIRTFINTGTAGSPNYVFAPQYALNFPEVDGSMTLVDYNCDGITDLVATAVAFTVYKGYYNSKNQLCFSFYKGLTYDNDTLAGHNNCYVSPADIPAVVDVDNDGDLDFLSFNIDGNKIYWYKNVQVEEGLPCDSIRIKLKDKCWGKFYQYGYLTNKLGYNCDADNGSLLLGPGERKTHTGNAMCLLDIDGDGDYDLFDGNAGYDNIVFLLNGKIPYSTDHRDSMIYQDTTWDRTKYSISLPNWPAPFFIDIDQDGARDLLVAPNTTGENYRCILYFKNTGTDTHPNFVFQSDTFLIDKTIDIGSASYPFFYDYNKDGKPDLFIGSMGYYEAGIYHSRIAYYLNTSTPGNPSLTLQTNDFLNLGTYNFAGASLAIGDIDNDGKDDLVIGHTDGTLSYFKNIASSNNVQPQWELGQLVLKDTYGLPINVGGNAAPCVYDLDSDGRPDLIIGAHSGYLQYYRNMATVPGQVSMRLINNQLGGVKVDKVYAGYSVPFIGKIDNTGLDYLLVGSHSGLLYRFTGFQHANTSGIYPMIDSNYSFIDSGHLSIYSKGNYDGFRSAPAIADVAGDGKFEMVVGNTHGGLMLYKQDTLAYDTVSHVAVPVNTAPVYVALFPNPAKNLVTVSWNKSFSNTDVRISIVSTTGQKISETIVPAPLNKTELSVTSLSPGIYSCIIQSDTEIKILKLVIMR